MQELEEDTRQRLTVDIRILSNKKKSSHRTAYAAAINGQALWVDPSHSVVMDEVDNKEKQGNKRKHKFSKKSTCFQTFF